MVGQALDYYASRGGAPLRWGGSGAEALGLSGSVTSVQFHALFGPGGAVDPTTGERLVRTRRPGMELRCDPLGPRIRIGGPRTSGIGTPRRLLLGPPVDAVVDHDRVGNLSVDSGLGRSQPEVLTLYRVAEGPSVIASQRPSMRRAGTSRRGRDSDAIRGPSVVLVDHGDDHRSLTSR